MTVIAKKNEKVAEVVAGLAEGFTFEVFLDAFKTRYPKDWAKVEREFEKYERKTKPGKTHPMPNPTQYMKNALSVYLAAQ